MYIAIHSAVVKPIFMAFVDGGPDENPRHSGVCRKCIFVSLCYRVYICSRSWNVNKLPACALFRTSWMQVFLDRFLPAPLLVRVTPKGSCSRNKWCQKYRLTRDAMTATFDAIEIDINVAIYSHSVRPVLSNSGIKGHPQSYLPILQYLHTIRCCCKATPSTKLICHAKTQCK